MKGGPGVLPEQFGPYRLEELIGRGGMGEIYRAFDTVRQRTVAVKRLPPQLAADADFQARFRRESQLAARLAAPHIIPIHDFGEIEGWLFIDMRLVTGADLAALLAQQGPLPPPRALHIVSQVAAALDAAHADGLVHRDVKPSNVLITGDQDFVYLVDFGIARSLAGTALTATGMASGVGTPDYMAPERFQGGSNDPLVDVYSLACLLYECLTGRRPFPADDPFTVMYHHLNQPPPAPSYRRPQVPTGLDEVVARGMAKDPRLRYRTAGDLAAAARTALDPPPSTLPPPPTVTDGWPTGDSADARVQRPPPAAPDPANADRFPKQLSQPPSTPRPAQPLSRRLVPAAPAALLVLLAVVTVIIFTATAPFGTSPGQQGPTGEGVPGLERFYGQKLSWGGCAAFATTPGDQKAYANPDVQCTYLEVPLDYAKPNDRTIQVGLLRRSASDPSQRIGSLVINPGGPGASGMSWAAGLADQLRNNELGRRFDVVGYDPRGVGSSKPQVQCLTAAGRDAERLMNLHVDTSPEGVSRTENHERAENAECETRTGKDVLANIGTREVVRDMDIMRRVLGDDKLTYLGYGYGTRVGSSYAEAFPGNVRAMILDGAVDPARDPVAHPIDQAGGFQKAFDAFAAWCVNRPDCALGQDKGRAVKNFQDRVRPLINNPVRVSGGRKLSYTDATNGTLHALYNDRSWPALNQGLAQLATGDGSTLLTLADRYSGRSADGTYSTATDAFQAVLCVDNPPVTDRNVARNVDAQYRAMAPFLNTGLPASPALDNCAFWPVPPTGGPHHPQVDGLPPVVVISNTQDPVTPYQAGINLARDLKARLLTFEGTQHTAFLQGIGCVDRAGIAYLVELKLPPEGTRCQATG